MSEESRTRTRAPVFLFVALMVAVLVPVAVMWAAVADPALLGYVLGFAVYFLVVHVYLPYRVHRHATFAGRNATVWAAVAFFVPLVGPALYFLVAVRDGDAAAAE